MLFAKIGLSYLHFCYLYLLPVGFSFPMILLLWNGLPGSLASFPAVLISALDAALSAPYAKMMK